MIATGSILFIVLMIGEHGRMEVIRILADLHVADIPAARSFYTEFLGLSEEDFNLGWVARFSASESSAYDQTVRIQLVTHDASAPLDPVASILTPNITAAYEEAQQRGYEIVHPLTHEPWGVHRFFVRAPDGNVFNIVHHVT
ncbi:VOC family protein [Microbacterium sp. ZW T2_14]|uniref:VOC family protein n=1 Tax=Microbacterium sp. ZW T2_14 TaxID=3378079 RepID=UPI0038519B2A